MHITAESEDLCCLGIFRVEPGCLCFAHEGLTVPVSH